MSTLRQEHKNIYWAWKAMKQRTQNPRCKAYKNYGARGITVCNDWQQFEPFCFWALANGYANGLDLDRIDNNGGYSPSNCRWVSRVTNVNNRRVTIFLTVDGTTRCCHEWELICGIPRGTLKSWFEKKGREYAETRIKDALRNGYVEKDYGNQRKAVLHIESGTVFNSVREAANHFGVSRGSLSHSINHRGGKTRKGRFTYEVIG